MVGIISVVIGGHFGGGDHFDGGDHFGGGTSPHAFTDWDSGYENGFSLYLCNLRFFPSWAKEAKKQNNNNNNNNA